MHISTLTACLLMACVATGCASTAPPPPQARLQPQSPADPLHAHAAVPAATTPAPLAGYRSAGSAAVQPGAWREANDNVGRIGGWRTYAREASAPAPAASAPAATPAHRH